MYYRNKMLITADLKISEILINNPYLLLMLEHFDINKEVKEKTVEQICVEYSISSNLFITIAHLFYGIKPKQTTEFSVSDIQTIISYLKKSHNYYQQEKYPQLKNYIVEIHNVNKHAEVLMIEKFVDQYIAEVTEHLEYENKVVFPYILELNQQINNKNKTNIAIQYSVTEYKEHHNDIEEKLNDLKNILIKYLPHNNDEQIRRNLLFCLVEIEYDLNIHSQIEDSILIPLVEKMEQVK